MQEPRVIVSGGGTGGHIFPAIAIAEGIKSRYPNAKILFVGAKGRMEMEKVPQAGFEIEGLWISGLQRKLTLKNLSFPFKVISSLMRAASIVRKFKPDVAVGVGGYASGPLLRTANRKGIKTVIQEQNSYPGITNKLLAKKTDRICVAYDGLERWFPADRIVKTGNPIRAHVVKIEGKRNHALEHFGLSPDKLTVFAMGGSLGARTINESLAAMAHRFKGDIQLLWQTGSLYINEAEKIATDNPSIVVRQFIRDMDLAYAAADVIVSRAGAMSISELCVVGKPCIFIPFPFASEDHQTHNARALVDQGAALLIADKDARQKLEKTLFDLVENKELQKSMGEKIKTLGAPNATDLIVDEIVSLIS